MKLSLIAGLAGAVLMAAGCAGTPTYHSYPSTMTASVIETRVYPLREGESIEIAAGEIANAQAALLVKKGDLDQEYAKRMNGYWVRTSMTDRTLILTTTPAGHAQFEAALRALK